MLSGKMPIEVFPFQMDCQGSVDEYYTQHTKYKIFPSVLLVNQNSATPSRSVSQFEEGRDMVQSINSGIFINDASCKLILSTFVKTRNYIYATYTGRIPLDFYGPKTKKGEHFKLCITNNDLDRRTFAKEEDLSLNSSSRDKTTIYSDGRS